MTALVTMVTCLGGCGVLGTGRTGDPPQRRVREGWTRWAELDGLAERHAKAGHPTHTTTVPALRATQTAATAARAAEVLARPLAGLGLDGIGASLSVRPETMGDLPTADEPDAVDCVDGRRARARLAALADRWQSMASGAGSHTSTVLKSCADELRTLIDGAVL